MIPAFNVEPWVGNAIESALQQSCPPKEVIVVDDGSSDGTANVVRRYVSDFPDTVRLDQQANQGASAARNRGLEQATGQYLQFLDADDWLHHRKFEKQVAILDAYTDVDVLFSDCWHVWHGGEKESGIKPADFPESMDCLLWKMLATGACPHPNSLLLRNRAVKEKGVQWNEDLAAYQDWDFQLQLVTTGAVFHRYPEALCYYRRCRPGSIWHEGNLGLVQALEQAYQKWDSIHKEHPGLKSALAEGFFRTARGYAQAGSLVDALRVFKKVVGYQPEEPPDLGRDKFSGMVALCGGRIALASAWVKYWMSRRVSRLWETI